MWFCSTSGVWNVSNLVSNTNTCIVIIESSTDAKSSASTNDKTTLRPASTTAPSEITTIPSSNDQSTVSGKETGGTTVRMTSQGTVTGGSPTTAPSVTSTDNGGYTTTDSITLKSESTARANTVTVTEPAVTSFVGSTGTASGIG